MVTALQKWSHNAAVVAAAAGDAADDTAVAADDAAVDGNVPEGVDWDVLAVHKPAVERPCPALWHRYHSLHQHVFAQWAACRIPFV